MKTAIQFLKHIPTIISVKKKLRKLSLTRYENNKWRATYLLDDIGDRCKWTENGIFVKDIPVADGDSFLDVLQKLDAKIERLKL